MSFNAGIQTRLTAFVLMIAIVPILALFAFTFRSNVQFYDEQVTDATSVSINRTVMGIDHTMESIEQVMDFILYNQIGWDNDVQAICREEYSQDDVPAYKRLVSSRIFEYTSRQAAYNNKNIESVCLYTSHQYNYSYNKSYKSEMTMKELAAEWERMQERNSPYFSACIIQRPSGPYILCSKNVVDTDTGKVIGMLTLVCSVDIFSNISDGEPPWSSTFVIDEKGSVLFGDTNRAALELSALDYIAANRNGYIANEGITGSIFFRSLRKSDWIIVSQITMDSFYKLYYRNTVYLVVVVGLCIISALLISVLFSRSFTKPIVQLSKTMTNTVPNSLAVTSSYIERNDEVGILYRRFGAMVDKINMLIEERYVREIELLSSKVKNLVAQINSHFVFNTLETINCVAEIEEIDTISIMSKSLGDMLRYSIDYEADEVPLQSEIKHIREYLSIQEVRFGKKIHLDVRVSRELAGCQVLKFMLQPIVENAVEHGLYSCGDPWEIVIEARKIQDTLHVSVQDNGIGIDGQKLREILHRLNVENAARAPAQEDAKHFSIGLLNIHRRIQLLYSSAYGLDITKGELMGTTVLVTIPFREAKETIHSE